MWRDLLYFSKGERSGFIVLISIIVIAGTILVITNQTKPANEKSNNGSSSAQKSSSVDNTSSAQKSSSVDNTTTAENTNSVPSSSEPSEKPAPANPSPARNARETVPERVTRLTSYSQPAYARVEKFAEGTTIELNAADTTTLKKVPGIGSAFAKRIINYRAVLGGYYSVTQLSEVYGIDEERYLALHSWFTVDPSHIKRIEINRIPQDSLQRHPYISYAQAKVITQMRRQKGKLAGWENLHLLNEFTESDKERLQHYLSFE